MNDSLQIFKDSLNTINQSNLQQHNDGSNAYFTYVVGIIGVIGAVVTFYAYYQSRKSKKLQDFVFKQAQIALEKESTQEKLNQTKEELSNVENRLTELQKQIQKDLPIEARKAVLKDRLEESFENLKKYYDDVISTKSKLMKLGISNVISDELLKNIQQEIEPRFIIKEKISTFKTYLTLISTLAGITFATLPYPFDKYIGVTLLLLGLPFVVQIGRLYLIKNSKDKQTTNLKIKLILSFLGTLITLISSGFFWLIVLTDYNRNQEELTITAGFLTIITLVLIGLTLALWLKYRRINNETLTKAIPNKGFGGKLKENTSNEN